MPSPSLTLWIDIATGKLLSGWQSISFAPAPVLKQGDTIGVELHLLNNLNGGSFAEYQFSPSTAVTLAVGKIDAAPTSGTYKLSYGANTTSEISATATATNVQTALNALASITAEGGVTVTKVSNSFRIVWNTPSVTSNELSYSSKELYPTSSIGVNKVKTGSISQKQVYQVHVKQSPVANITSFVNQDDPAISVSQIHTPAFTGDLKVWRISISPQPKSGSFLIGFNNGLNEYTTNSIDVSSSAENVRTIISSAYDASWSVVKSGTNQWDIATAEDGIFNVTVSDGGVVGFSSKYGVLNLNTAEVEDLLAGETSVNAVLEVQLETDGTRTTVLQQQISILNDLIDDASYDIVNWGTYIPADAVVRYDTAQTLSPAEKAQAKQNIGVSDVDTTSLIAKDIELEGRIGELEDISLSQTQLDAISGSSLPSSLNVFVTASALSTGLATKASTTHTHTIANIDGLGVELSDKAEIGHTHTIADVSGLSTSLSGKADITSVNTSLLGKSDTTHTHTEFTTLEITSSLTISSGSTGAPWSTSPCLIEEVGLPVSTPSGVIYNFEIPIKINGVIYLIPARTYP